MARRPVANGWEEPETLLRVRDLSVRYPSSSTLALDTLSFDLKTDETVGLLGESGAGKSTLARALIRLLPADCRILSGSIRLRETEILCASEVQLERVRGAQIAVIFQEPELALNPVLPAGEQIEEVLRAHSRWSKQRRQEEVRSVLAEVGLSDPHVYSAYPYELSGGQRQRIAIAQALISKPSLLVADEPTSALDTVTQSEVLQLLKRLKERLRLTLLFITHNPALLTGLADRVIVMHGGRIVESGNLNQIWRRPSHSFTAALVKAALSFADGG